MPKKDSDVFDKLQQIMTDALLEMRALISSDTIQKASFVSMINPFLLSIISTAADLAEVTNPGASAYIYTEIESAVKEGGLRAVRKALAQSRSYSVSDIAPDDFSTAMNYLGQELGITLFKHIHDLPTSLRKPEMLLRGIEALLGNVLDQKFGQELGHDPNKILDNFCEHVHMVLKDLKMRRETKGESNILIGSFNQN